MRKTMAPYNRLLFAAFVLQVFLYTPYVSSVAHAGEPSPANRKNVAVVEFQTKGDVGIPDAGSIVAEWMISSLLKTGKFALKERVLLTKVLEEQSLGLSGLIDEKTLAAQAGKLFGVEAIITGTVIKWGNVISVTSRMVDTQSGAILIGADVKTADVNHIPDKIDQLAGYLAGIRKEPPPSSVGAVGPPETSVWRIGDRVLVNWTRDSYWYPGTISDKKESLYFINYDDGDKEWVNATRIRAEEIAPGDRVYCNWKNRGTYYPGTVTRRTGLSIHINYDDGDQEDTTISFVRIK
jgi:hypothetical protein